GGARAGGPPRPRADPGRGRGALLAGADGGRLPGRVRRGRRRARGPGCRGDRRADGAHGDRDRRGGGAGGGGGNAGRGGRDAQRRAGQPRRRRRRRGHDALRARSVTAPSQPPSANASAPGLLSIESRLSTPRRPAAAAGWDHRRVPRSARLARVRSPYDGEIVRLALPALGALAAEPLYVLVDTAIVGHLGRPQLAALGLAGTVLAGAFTIFNFLTYG